MSDRECYDMQALVLRAMVALGPTDEGFTSDEINAKIQWLIGEGFVEVDKAGEQFHDTAGGEEYFARKKAEWPEFAEE